MWCSIAAPPLLAEQHVHGPIGVIRPIGDERAAAVLDCGNPAAHEFLHGLADDDAADAETLASRRCDSSRLPTDSSPPNTRSRIRAATCTYSGSRVSSSVPALAELEATPTVYIT